MPVVVAAERERGAAALAEVGIGAGDQIEGDDFVERAAAAEERETAQTSASAPLRRTAPAKRSGASRRSAPAIIMPALKPNR
jgi:hypothetical protein